MTNRSKKLAFTVLTAAALSAALPAASASAAEEVACGPGNDQVKVTYVQDGTEHSRCWEDAGPVTLNLDGVVSVYSGANEIVVFWTTGSGWSGGLVEPHSWVPFTGADTYHLFGFQVR